MATQSQETLTDAEKHRRSKLYARLTYGAIIIIFLTVCVVAVTATMSMEKNKQGFKAIQLSKPISFFDYTYVDERKSATHAEAPASP